MCAVTICAEAQPHSAVNVTTDVVVVQIMFSIMGGVMNDGWFI